MGAVSALILASTSVYRRELLARLGVPFEVLAPGVPEAHVPGESPADRALRLALEKAGAVGSAHPQAVVIGAEQVAACAGLLLEKPGNAARCRASRMVPRSTITPFSTDGSIDPAAIHGCRSSSAFN